jgi:hypothetical protein
MATDPGGPRRGDVVVWRDSAAGEYRLQVFRRATQLRFCTREDAVRDAITFAEIHRVDVWHTCDGTRYELAVTCRRHRRGAREPWTTSMVRKA